MANAKNLKRGNPATQFKSGREASENGRKGGKASGKSRRRKKAMKDTAAMLLSLDIPEDSKNYALFKNLGIPEEDITWQTAILYSMMQKAIKGSVGAAEFMRDTAGDNLADSQKYSIAKDDLKLKREQFEHEKEMDKANESSTAADEWADLIGDIEDEETNGQT